MYIASQNSLILGSFDTEELATNRCLEEIKRDDLQLVLKKKLLKKVLKGQIPINGNTYLVSKVLKEVTKS